MLLVGFGGVVVLLVSDGADVSIASGGVASAGVASAGVASAGVASAGVAPVDVASAGAAFRRSRAIVATLLAGFG